MKMRPDQKIEENKPALKSNFTQEYIHPDMIFLNIWGHPLSHWALLFNVHWIVLIVHDQLSYKEWSQRSIDLMINDYRTSMIDDDHWS